MMAIRDIQGRAQIMDGGQQFKGKGRMLPHDLLLLFGERTGIHQNRVGHRHLADIVEQSAPADMVKLILPDAKGAGDPQGQLRHPLGVPLCFRISQLQGLCPPLDGGVVGQG